MAEKSERGKTRLFLVLALEARVLAYAVHTLHQQSALCERFFEAQSVWRAEEGATLAAMLVALNGVEFQISAAATTMPQLDDPSALPDVLEEIRGGKQEAGWGPFGFIRAKKTKKKKKKPVVDLEKPEDVATSPVVEAKPLKVSSSSFVEEERHVPIAVAVEAWPDDEDEAPPPPMRHLEQILGASGVTPPAARPPPALFVPPMFLDDEPEAAVLVEATSEHSGSAAEEFEEDERDRRAKSQSASPAKASFMRRTGNFSETATGTTTTTATTTPPPPDPNDSISGALFLPEPALRATPRRGVSSSSGLGFLSSEDDAKMDLKEEEEHVDEEEASGTVELLQDQKSVVEEERVFTPPVKSLSAFELELLRLEDERVALEEEKRKLAGDGKEKQEDEDGVASPVVVASEKIVMRERPSPMSSDVPQASKMRELVVVGDAGDLFVLSLVLTRDGSTVAPSSFEEGFAGNSAIVHTLSAVRTEPCVPTVSIRSLPVNLVADPIVMTASGQQRICADCLRKMDGGARFCNLFGRWFCFLCHRDEEAMLPSRVLRLWDLKRYKVCVFAKQEIGRAMKTLLFDLQDVNPGLFRVSDKLLAARNLRRQLVLLTAFVSECPLAAPGLRRVVPAMRHLADSSTVFSLHDLRLAQSGRLAAVLRDFSLAYLEHVAWCKSCASRRSPCISCRQPVFDFDVRRVGKCSSCGLSCHRACMHLTRCRTCAKRAAGRK